MKFASKVMLLAGAVLALTSSVSGAVPVFSEHVTGGVLDLVWTPGFNTPVRVLQPLTMDALDPAYANPSGDHTVAVAVNTIPDSGGIIMSLVDPGALNDYTWEGDMFTGAGNTRRGLFLRGDPTNGFTTGYQFVVESGLGQVRFRKLTGQGATTLGNWLLPITPPFNASLAQNTWIHLKVNAVGDDFRCWLNGVELTAGGPITDPSAPYLSGWVGIYNFRFDLGLVPVYFDDLVLSTDSDPTPAQSATWGAVKARYR